MFPRHVRNFNAFVDGRGYAGKVEEITLPKLTVKTEEFRAGGMDIPISMDLGMEKMDCELTFAEYDPALLKLFGLVAQNWVALTLRGALTESNKIEATPVVIYVQGTITELDFGTWQASEKASLKMKMDLVYYKLVHNGEELIEIDAEGMVRKIDGVDQMASTRQALGL